MLAHRKVSAAPAGAPECSKMDPAKLAIVDHEGSIAQPLGAVNACQKQNNPLKPVLGLFNKTQAQQLPGSPVPSSPPSQPSSKADYLPSSSLGCSSSPPRTVASKKQDARTRLSSIVPPSSPPPLDSSPPAKAGHALQATAPPSAQVIHWQEQQVLTITRGETIHFGRKLKTMQKAIATSESSADSRHTFVILPKAAKHASRRHCTVMMHRDSICVSAYGQNGVLLDGERVPEGQTNEISLEDGCKGFLLGFYTDVEVRIQPAAIPSSHHTLGREAESANLDQANPTSEATQLLDLSSSPPRATLATSLPASPEARPIKRVKRDSGLGRLSRASSEAVPSSDPYAHQEDNGYPPESSSESEDADEDEASRAAKLAQDARLREAFSRIKSAIKDGTLDIIGALCSSLVFQSRRATLTTSECVSVLLEDQPSLLSYGDEACWRAAVLSSLRTGPFGYIENTEGLKDAAGKRVETSWHYSPGLDNDEGRRNSLQPFVKTVRQAQRQRKQYFYKRPSDLRKVRRA